MKNGNEASTGITCVALYAFIFGTLAGYLASSIAFTIPSSEEEEESSKQEEQPTINRKEIITATDEKDDSDQKIVIAEEGKGRRNESDKITRTTSSENENSKPIRMVVQRCRTAKLLLRPPTNDREPIVAAIGSQTVSITSQRQSQSAGGIIVYLSFAKGATESMIYNAARTLLNLPILTTGHWGDGTQTLSVLQMAAKFDTSRGQDSSNQQTQEGISIVVVPQANLFSKIKNTGKSIQYHQQIDKTSGSALFRKFIDTLCILALQFQFKCRNIPIPSSLQNALKQASSSSLSSSSSSPPSSSIDASIPPEQMFLDKTRYSSWDGMGIPITDVDNEPLSKSSIKKMKKMYEAQKKRHEKFLTKTNSIMTTTSSSSKEERTKENEEELPEMDTNFICIVDGTFGNRQGLEFVSDMGPFCHVVDLGG